MRGESKCVTTKKQPNIKQGSNGGNKGEKSIKTPENKQLSGKNKYFPICNYFKCKWITLPFQKIEIGKINFKNTGSNCILPQETLDLRTCID